ncbi:ribosomal RNA small subunit methyltransferase B [Cellvibrio zantedeschiae]|uniref:16S rRNA (cytosine(967)-C(5))-methyltransferase n=1 Tax=Cellvibrio zantedeschiae TaxID=1237077 RepID=A0ABQ3BDL6_9GAMM|nr:16S rRNA (cytosine(967)-C(5))-methyltransferase RsmB [Cellvibrio zantedeschiae]GGY88511.1 ribosomal RNA small subunit methyltransferase B [Cellvibrio zantedeschiae]
MISVRAAAAQVLAKILQGQGSLSSLLPAIQHQVAEQDRPLLQELCFGTCRYQPQLSAYIECLVDKPLRAKDSDIQALLLLGLYQLLHTRIPDHAALGETVEVTRFLKKPWATSLVNGVLRKFQRDKGKLDKLLAQNYAFQTNHPAWMEASLRKNWPNQLEEIIATNNSHPPFTLRINTQKISRDKYLALLQDADIAANPTTFSPYGITLENACDPRKLPFFSEGWVSVQDEAAQLSADLLQLSPNLRILDACCAPGGKTGHILELEPNSQVTALDVDERRLGRVRENLARLGAEANIICGDGTTKDWWDGELFDRILLDAPCSATGIIRRHPDIKVLRTPEELDKLGELQIKLLNNLWSLLKPGGILVYATCSVMPKENTQVVEAFLKRQPQAECDILDAEWGISQTCGRQLLPSAAGHDGFYYARLRKL